MSPEQAGPITTTYDRRWEIIGTFLKEAVDNPLEACAAGMKWASSSPEGFRKDQLFSLECKAALSVSGIRFLSTFLDLERESKSGAVSVEELAQDLSMESAR